MKFYHITRTLVACNFVAFLSSNSVAAASSTVMSSTTDAESPYGVNQDTPRSAGSSTTRHLKKKSLKEGSKSNVSTSLGIL